MAKLVPCAVHRYLLPGLELNRLCCVWRERTRVDLSGLGLAGLSPAGLGSAGLGSSGLGSAMLLDEVGSAELRFVRLGSSWLS